MSHRFQPRAGFSAWVLVAGLAIGGLLAPALAAPAHADDLSARRSLTLSGTGQVSARPDIAYLDTGVVTEGKTAAEALAANTKAMEAIFAGLNDMQIAKDDIRTSQFAVNPVYNTPPARPDGTHEAPSIRGYQVTNEVSVTVRKLDRLGTTLDKLVQLGSNRLNGIRFDIEKPEALLDQARKEAVADALRKAKLYAHASGVALGPVLQITESGGYAPQPVFAKMMMRDSASVPVAAGMQQLTATVTLMIGIE